MPAAPERTFERGRGCYSCLSYDNGPQCQQHWEVHKMARLVQIRSSLPVTRLADLERGVGFEDARMQQVVAMDQAMKAGRVGFCRKGPRDLKDGGPEGDFVSHKFYCDRWSGRDGHSLATAGHAADPLMEELEDIADKRVKERE